MARLVSERVSGVPGVVLLRERDYRLFWLSGAGGSFGLNLWFLTASWLVLELTDSQLWVGLIGGLAAAPSFALSLVGGTLADRADRRRLLLAAAAAFTAFALGAAVLDATGVVSAWHILALALAIGFADAASNPAWRTLVVDLIGKPRLLAANALGQLGEFGGEVIAPLAVGFLLAAAGADTAFFLAAAFLLFGLTAMARMRTPPVVTPLKDAPSSSMIGEIRSGLSYTLGTPPFPALLLVSITTLAAAFIYPLIPVFARDELGVGARGFGVLAASLAAGMVTGALIMAATGSIPRRGISVLAARAVWFAGMAGFALSGLYPLSAALLFLMGVAEAVAGNVQQTLFQAHAEDRMRGRVMSVLRVTEAFEPLGFLVGGALAAGIGNVEALLAGAAAGGAVIAGLSVFGRSIRAL